MAESGWLPGPQLRVTINGTVETILTTPDGVSLWTETFGEPGQLALLLVMGAMNQGIFWPDAFCQQLADAGHFVIRYDHRDTGRSSKVGRWPPYTLKALARDALAVLQGLGVARATVVGLSMGGFIGQWLAVQHPERVERLVLISTSADHRPYVAATLGLPARLLRLPPPEPGYLAYLQRLKRLPPKTPEAVFASVSEGWATTYAGPRPYPRAEVEAAIRLAYTRTHEPLAALNHGLAVAVSRHRLELVKRIRVPTLVIHGRHDPLFPLPHGAYLAQHIPDARLVVLDMGHAFMWSWDAEVRDAILGFVRGG